MKSLVLQEYNELIIKETEIPELKEAWVLIKVEACGICGSDVHGMDGSTGRRQVPIIMGHEASGTIVKVSPEINNWKPGERVTFDSTISCGECYFCLRGEINLCENRMVVGVSCNEFKQNGAFAEFVAVPSRILYKIPENITFEQAAMIEAVSVAVHAVKISSGDDKNTACVIGCGMIGLLCIQALKNDGWKTIIAIDIENAKLSVALEMGADLAFLSIDSHLTQKIEENTSGLGVDLVLEVVGVEQTVNMAIDLVKKGGCVTLIGNLSKSINFPLQKVVTRQIKVQGSCASSGEYPLCIELISRGKIKVDKLISHVAPLEHGPDLFRKLYNKAPGFMKLILKP